MTVLVRSAIAADIDRMTDICFRAKAANGYDAAFMAACRDELRVTAADLAGAHFLVACGPEILGCGALRPLDRPWGEVTSLFVDPDRHGTGIGRAIWDGLLAVARAQGVTQITLDADPAAEPFHRRMGCQTVGQSPSGSIPGRVLPRMEIAV